MSSRLSVARLVLTLIAAIGGLFLVGSVDARAHAPQAVRHVHSAVSHAYDPPSAPTTGPTGASFGPAHTYDRSISPSGRTIVVALGSSAAEEAANEGIYVINGARGTYVGQSGNIANRLAGYVSSGRFTQAEVDAAQRIAVSGGKTAREIAEQQKIDELGGVDSLLNIRNPIGARRFDLMPQPYSRP